MKVMLKELLAHILKRPIVVESGTSGIWTYRKWSDGTAECWGRWNGNITQYFSFSAGGMTWYVYYTTINYPFTFVGRAPVRNYTARAGSAFSWTASNLSNTTYSSNYYILAIGSQPTENFDLDIYAIGRWK
ncbi:MAG: hypothetical protein IKE74_03275 [Mogibacterium sp.]|nr:hypothetical protein [Mogibacterium sp.]